MDWREAMELVIERTGHERFRSLCADDHPAHEAWRARMIEKASGAAPAEYPPVGRQALNLAGAVVRVAAAAVAGRSVLAPADVVAARRALCLPCEFNGLREKGGIRCTKCGCTGVKLSLAPMACPVGKWPRWEAPDRDDD